VIACAGWLISVVAIVAPARLPSTTAQRRQRVPLQFGEDWRIDPADSLIQALRDQFGRDNVFALPSRRQRSRWSVVTPPRSVLKVFSVELQPT
jgi:hypothetical protein